MPAWNANKNVRFVHLLEKIHINWRIILEKLKELFRILMDAEEDLKLFV
jgi:hypothetical protein